MRPYTRTKIIITMLFFSSCDKASEQSKNINTQVNGNSLSSIQNELKEFDENLSKLVSWIVEISNDCIRLYQLDDYHVGIKNLVETIGVPVSNSSCINAFRNDSNVQIDSRCIQIKTDKKISEYYANYYCEKVGSEIKKCGLEVSHEKVWKGQDCIINSN